MERVLTALEMQQADKYTMEKLGVPQAVLVERAGSVVAEEIIKRFNCGKVLVCIGKGNNGADGRVIYQKLIERGFNVQIFEAFKGDFTAFNQKFDVIVDCIFGVGLNRKVEGDYAKAIELINNSGAFIVACDIVSGLNSDNGMVEGVCVKANLTVAIQDFKLGHFFGDGIDFSGEVIARDIGISSEKDDFIKIIDKNAVKDCFSKPKRNVHKGCFGKCAVIGGSRDYSGSVVLSANAHSTACAQL